MSETAKTSGTPSVLDAALGGVFRRVFEDDALEIADEMDAEDIEKWDSLMHVNLIVAVEKDFGVRFKNSEIARLASIGDLKKLLIKHRPELNG